MIENNTKGTKHTRQKLSWRKRNREKWRLQRQRYYDKTKIIEEVTKRRPTGVPARPWEQWELNVILQRGLKVNWWGMVYSQTDRQLGRLLHRSVAAIQERRWKLKKEMNEKV